MKAGYVENRILGVPSIVYIVPREYVSYTLLMRPVKQIRSLL